MSGVWVGVGRGVVHWKRHNTCIDCNSIIIFLFTVYKRVIYPEEL